MIYSHEVQTMCPVAQGVNHGPAPIPEEAKWVKAKEVKDISGLTHGVGWCAPQQGACKLTLNAKKYRHNVEYGSARWGTAKDIEPFIAPKFEDNVILTKTERLMMSNRPKNPANARNKNVLIIGGSGSGKTRFWLKPNLLQMHSSYVVTDPKGSV